MGRRPSTDLIVQLQVGANIIPVHTSTLTLLPEAGAFLAYLLDRGSVAGTAREYVRLVAKAKRDGRLHDPDSILQRAERTAVRAYWQWIAQHYEARIGPVLRAITDWPLRDSINQLRVGALVPPFEGKRIPFVTLKHRAVDLGQPTNEPPRRLQPIVASVDLPFAETHNVRWDPCTTWTLHVPRPKTTIEAHEDPCVECVPIPLNETQLQAVATAFYSAWGVNATPNALPREALLFGTPPLTSVFHREFDKGKPKPARVVALLPDGPVSNAIDQIRGSVTSQVNAFLERIQNRPDVIVLSREAMGSRYDEVMGALHRVWAPEPAAAVEPSPDALPAFQTLVQTQVDSPVNGQTENVLPFELPSDGS